MFQNRLGEEADALGGQSARFGVDGREAAGVARVVRANQFVGGMRKVEVVFGIRYGNFAGKVRELAGPENIFNIGLVEPHGADGPGLVRDGRFNNNDAFLPRASHFYLLHGAANGRLLTRFKVAHAVDLRKVLVAERKVPEEVLYSFNMKRGKPREKARPDAVDGIQTRGEVQPHRFGRR